MLILIDQERRFDDRNGQPKQSIIKARDINCGILIAVLDGMSSDGAGNLATSTAKDSICDAWNELPPPDDPIFIIKKLMEEAQAAVMKGSGGAACLLVLIQGDLLTFGHVGDCQLFESRQHKPLRAITVDHSALLRTRHGRAVKEQFEQADEAQAEKLWTEYATLENQLTRYLGHPYLEPDKTREWVEIGQIRLERDMFLLLCSDGVLKAMNPGSELVMGYTNIEQSQANIHAAIDEYRRDGDHDDATFCIVHVVGEPESVASRTLQPYEVRYIAVVGEEPLDAKQSRVASETDPIQSEKSRRDHSRSKSPKNKNFTAPTGSFDNQLTQRQANSGAVEAPEPVTPLSPEQRSATSDNQELLKEMLLKDQTEESQGTPQQTQQTPATHTFQQPGDSTGREQINTIPSAQGHSEMPSQNTEQPLPTEAEPARSSRVSSLHKKGLYLIPALIIGIAAFFGIRVADWGANTPSDLTLGVNTPFPSDEAAQSAEPPDLTTPIAQTATITVSETVPPLAATQTEEPIETKQPSAAPTETPPGTPGSGIESLLAAESGPIIETFIYPGFVREEVDGDKRRQFAALLFGDHDEATLDAYVGENESAFTAVATDGAVDGLLPIEPWIAVAGNMRRDTERAQAYHITMTNSIDLVLVDPEGNLPGNLFTDGQPDEQVAIVGLRRRGGDTDIWQSAGGPPTGNTEWVYEIYWLHTGDENWLPVTQGNLGIYDRPAWLYVSNLTLVRELIAPEDWEKIEESPGSLAEKPLLLQGEWNTSGDGENQPQYLDSLSVQLVYELTQQGGEREYACVLQVNEPPVSPQEGPCHTSE
jgi:serine/threonine protein phosphatase PrpC